MLKLTYSHPNDEFQTITVLGDARGIFDLWFRLSQATPEYKSHGVGKIKVRNLDGYEIDMTKGIDNAICARTSLSSLDP